MAWRAVSSLTHTLPPPPPAQVTEVFSQTRNGEHVKITITLTNELPPTSPTCLQFYNIIFRRYLRVRRLLRKRGARGGGGGGRGGWEAVGGRVRGHRGWESAGGARPQLLPGPNSTARAQAGRPAAPAPLG